MIIAECVEQDGEIAFSSYHSLKRVTNHSMEKHLKVVIKTLEAETFQI
jgi:hypothetical protein